MIQQVDRAAVHANLQSSKHQKPWNLFSLLSFWQLHSDCVCLHCMFVYLHDSARRRTHAQIFNTLGSLSAVMPLSVFTSCSQTSSSSSLSSLLASFPPCSPLLSILAICITSLSPSKPRLLPRTANMPPSEIPQLMLMYLLSNGSFPCHILLQVVMGKICQSPLKLPRQASKKVKYFTVLHQFIDRLKWSVTGWESSFTVIFILHWLLKCRNYSFLRFFKLFCVRLSFDVA